MHPNRHTALALSQSCIGSGQRLACGAICQDNPDFLTYGDRYVKNWSRNNRRVCKIGAIAQMGEKRQFLQVETAIWPQSIKTRRHAKRDNQNTVKNELVTIAYRLRSRP